MCFIYPPTKGIPPSTHRLGQVACALGGVEDLVEEDGEVEREAEADRVGRGQVQVGQLGSRLVRIEGVGRACLAVFGGLELGKIPIKIVYNKRREKQDEGHCWCWVT